MALPQEKSYTIDDIYALPEGQRAELIDGQMYMMAPPNTSHQRISHFLEWEIENYIHSKDGVFEEIFRKVVFICRNSVIIWDRFR